MLRLFLSFCAAVLFGITFGATEWIGYVSLTIGIYYFPGAFLFLVVFLFCAFMFSDRFK